MKYEDMSDFEINEQVARLRFDVFAACHDGSRKNGSVRASGAEFDPCNNPSDAWPIILKTCMTIELPDPNLGGIGTNTIYNPRGTDWQCDYNNGDQCFRAAMICFLKMKDAENE